MNCAGFGSFSDGVVSILGNVESELRGTKTMGHSTKLNGDVVDRDTEDRAGVAARRLRSFPLGLQLAMMKSFDRQRLWATRTGRPGAAPASLPVRREAAVAQRRFRRLFHRPLPVVNVAARE